MHVAVAIVGFRNCDDIARCLAALEHSSHTDFEIIICENGGRLAFERLQDALPDCLPGGQRVSIVSADDNPGYAGGLNACLRQTPQADAWWVLNPDTRPHSHTMQALIERLLIGDCDGVGGTVYLASGTVQSHGGVWQAWLARAVSIGHGRMMPDPVDWRRIESKQNYLSGASMLVSRRFLQIAGPLREDYFLYCEEVEWCIRAVKRGLRLAFSPAALVLHFEGTTTGSSAVMKERAKLPIFIGERNQMLLTRDHFPLRFPIVAVAAFIVILLRYGRRGAWRQLSYGLQGWRAGLANERGRPVWWNPIE